MAAAVHLILAQYLENLTQPTGIQKAFFFFFLGEIRPCTINIVSCVLRLKFLEVSYAFYDRFYGFRTQIIMSVAIFFR